MVVDAHRERLGEHAERHERDDERARGSLGGERKCQRPHRHEDQHVARAPAPVTGEEQHLDDHEQVRERGQRDRDREGGRAREEMPRAEHRQHEGRAEQEQALPRAHGEAEERRERVAVAEGQRIVVAAFVERRSEPRVVERQQRHEPCSAREREREVPPHGSSLDRARQAHRHRPRLHGARDDGQADERQEHRVALLIRHERAAGNSGEQRQEDARAPAGFPRQQQREQQPHCVLVLVEHRGRARPPERRHPADERPRDCSPQRHAEHRVRDDEHSAERRAKDGPGHREEEPLPVGVVAGQCSREQHERHRRDARRGVVHAVDRSRRPDRESGDTGQRPIEHDRPPVVEPVPSHLVAELPIDHVDAARARGQIETEQEERDTERCRGRGASRGGWRGTHGAGFAKTKRLLRPS